MATINKPVIMAKPASLSGSIKKTTITTPAAKKPLKSDTALKKTSIAAPKTTSLVNKTPSKPVVSKMASTKVLAAIVDKPAVSSKPLLVKSSITSPSKPVLAKIQVKRAIADSTSSDKESAAKPVRKLSIPTGLTKLTKVVTKPVTSSPTPGAKVSAVKTKSTPIPSKPVAEKLPVKAKLISSTLPSKTSSVLTKPVATSSLTKRPSAPKTVDIKKPVVLKPVLAKSVSKIVTSAVKPSIRTPIAGIAGKKVIKKCADVQICDADSTSLTANDQLEMELGVEFGTVAPRETSVEFNEKQAYIVAEQMIEALRTSAMMNEGVHQDSMMKDSVVIDMSALEVTSQTVPTDDVLAATSVETNVLEQTADIETVSVDDVSAEKIEEEASTPDLISFVEDDQKEEPASGELAAENTEEVAEDAVVKGDLQDVVAESVHDEDKDIELSMQNQASESDEVQSDEGAVSDEESEQMEEKLSEQKLEHCAEDDTREVENCKEFVDDLEMSNNHYDLATENEVVDENIHNESCTVEAQANDENIETEEQGEVISEGPSTADLEIACKHEADAVSPAKELQLEQPAEMSEEVVDPTISISIQEDHFSASSDPLSVNVNLECNSDDFVVVEMGKRNGEEEMEKVPLIVDDCSPIEAEKFADTESVASVDSVASYADVVKQSAIEGAGDFESIENEKPLVNLEGEEDQNTSEQMVLGADNLLVELVVNEEDVAVTGAAAANAEAIEAAGDAEACDATGDVEKNPVEEQTVKVEPLLGLMTDEVQQELDAGMEHSHAEDEEGYVKMQKKRNKKHHKRNRKSLKALQKENTDFEPVTQVQESQDDLQVSQKRRNFRRAKNSMKKQYRRHSEPYSNSHCYATPVWKSYYVEH